MIKEAILNFIACTALGLTGFQIARLLNRWSRRQTKKVDDGVLERDLKESLDRSFELGKIAGRSEIIHEQCERRLNEMSQN